MANSGPEREGLPPAFLVDPGTKSVRPVPWDRLSGRLPFLLERSCLLRSLAPYSARGCELSVTPGNWKTAQRLQLPGAQRELFKRFL